MRRRNHGPGYILRERQEPVAVDAPQPEPVRAAKIHAQARSLDPELARFGQEMNRAEMWARLICLGVGTVCGLLGIAALILAWPDTYGALALLLVAAVCLARGVYGGDSDLRVVDLLSWVGYARRPPL